MNDESGSAVTGERPSLPAAQVVVTVVLLLGHAALMLFAFILSFGMVMGTDVCAYEECGDEK